MMDVFAEACDYDIGSLMDDMRQAYVDYMAEDDGSGDRSVSSFDADVLRYGLGFEHDMSEDAYQSARKRVLGELRNA